MCDVFGGLNLQSFTQSNPLKRIALGPDYEYPVRQRIHLSNDFDLHFTMCFSALTLLVGRQEGHPACKKTYWWGAGVVICLE